MASPLDSLAALPSDELDLEAFNSRLADADAAAADAWQPTEVDGDVLEFEEILGAISGATIIAHVTNTLGRWGAGFVVPLGDAFPAARDAFLSSALSRRLGHVGLVEVDKARNVFVANMSAQPRLRRRGGVCALSYPSLRRCLRALRGHVERIEKDTGEEARVVMPCIGAGLVGVDWARISGIIRAELRGLDVTIFTLPSGPKRVSA